MNIQQHIRKLKDAGKKATILESLLAKFPDLSIHTNRWDKQRYSSALANDKVTDVDISHNCGCCSDSPLEVWPFLEIDGVRVYSSPIPFYVGERDGIGERPNIGWENELKEASIADIVIQKVAKYFADHPPYDDDDI